MPSILFICTANRSRSPLAAAFLSKNLEGIKGPEFWKVSSAGTWAISGLPVMPGLVEAGRKFGIDLSGHRSRQVDPALLAGSDLVVVMQAGHKDALLVEDPGLQDRVHLLSEVVEHRSYDIPDPLGSRQEALELVAELDSLVRQGTPALCALAAQLNNSRSIRPSQYE